MLKTTPYWNRFGCTRLARTVLASVVAAIGLMPLTASAQTSNTSRSQPPSAARARLAASRGEAARRATANIEGGNRSPPATLSSSQGHTDPSRFAAKKAQAARLRGATPRASGAPDHTAKRAFDGSAGAERLQDRRPPPRWCSAPKARIACGDVTPADQALAVGDTAVGVFQAINLCINVFDKTGVKQAGYPKSLTSFVGLPSSTPTSDPRAMYDWINHRYILAFIQFDPNFATASSYWIAVSQGDNPAGDYCIYKIGVQSVAPSGGVFPLPDFPRIGQDKEAIYSSVEHLYSRTTSGRKFWSCRRRRSTPARLCLVSATSTISTWPGFDQFHPAGQRL